MKRMLSLLLVLALLLSGCGGGETTEAVKAAAETAAATENAVPEATASPTTEPALSAEEVLYNSLPEKLRCAVDLEIVELDVLDDLTRICKGAEAAQMLQNA